MRRAAYLKALEQASKLPTTIPEYERYFNRVYNPRLHAINHIQRIAASDNLLFVNEIADVLNWKEADAESHDNSKPSEQATSEEDRINT